MSNRLQRAVLALSFMLPAASAIPAASAAAAQDQVLQFSVQASIPLPGPARWDYLAFEQGTHRLFVSQYTQLDVVDVASDKRIATLSGLKGMHGIAFAPKLGQGYISDGKAGLVRVFDLATLRMVGDVRVGKDPDAIAYDPASGLVFTPNGDSRTLSIIRPVRGKAGKVVATIPLHADPEFLVADGHGAVFLNLNSADQIAVIDTRTLKITRKIELAPSCKGPTGLAIDRRRERLFVSCRNNAVDVVKAKTGAVLATLPITGFSDAMRYDPALNLAFAPTIDGKLNVIGADGKHGYRIVQTVTTEPGARTMAMDRHGPALFLTSARLVAMKPPTASIHHPRPVFAPGSTHVLVVGPAGKPG